MTRRKALFSGFAVALVLILAGTLPLPAQQAPAGQVVKLGEGETLTISGFISTTLFNDRGLWGAFGQGQNAEYAAIPGSQPSVGQSITDGDFRNTRIRFDFAAPPVIGKWAPRATIEADFFGAYNGNPPFGDEQPQLRGRLIFADLTNGRTTLRIGQDWSPSFAETPVSLTHIAFPLGYGASGKIGWRFPGIFLFQDLSAAGAPLNVQMQLAVMKGSGPPASARDAGATQPIGSGEASGLPQLEAKFTFSRKSANLAWSLYAVGHIDWKDTVGTGVPKSNLTGNAFEVGGSIAPGHFTLHGNYYTGKAIGQLFGHINQSAPASGDIHGWGAWAQAGYDFDPHWSFFGFYGLDQPDLAQFALDHPTAVLARQMSHVGDALLRFRAGRYAIGLEYYRANTLWNTGLATADQYALSLLYTF